MHGQFVWNDLMTTDVAAAKRFYAPLTGWSPKLWDKSTPQQQYTLWMHDGAPIGGVVELTSAQRAQGQPPAWLPSVSVNNVDSTARQAASLGGKIHMPPADIPDTGRYAVLQDPQGAFFAIFTPKNPMPGFDGTPQVGRFAWYELMTTDYKRAFDFYRQLFGWEKTGDEMDMGGGNAYLMYGMKGKMFGGIYNREPNMANVPPFWLTYVNVKDVDRTTDAAVKAGARLVNGPMDVPGGGRISVIGDPQGAAFAFFATGDQRAGAAKPAPRKSAKKATRKAKAKARPKAKATSKAKAKPKTKKTAKSRPKAKAKKKSRRR
jgi:uncharacterized protein